jgi:5-methylcytosine-specific restriction endonuclease McrA
VNRVQLKPFRLRLEADEYEELRQQVLCRDAWRCQLCGAKCNLEVHHKKFRGHLGDDCERNLITLCTACHQQVHQQSVRDEAPDGE